MKNTFLLITGLALFGLSSCVREEVYVYNEVKDVDVFYEHFTGPGGTSIEGSMINDGTTYLYSVELEVRMYDRYGGLIEKDWFWVDTYTYPGEESFFTIDTRIPFVSSVEVFPTNFD